MRHILAAVFLATLATALLTGCGESGPQEATESAAAQAEAQAAAQAFLDDYSTTYIELYSAYSETEWASNTHIVEGDDTNLKAQEAAHGAFAEFTGSTEVIEKTRALLDTRDLLTDLQGRQLDSILYQAANNPQTVPELVAKRITAEAKQTEALYGFDFKVNGKSVTTNDLDDTLVTATDLGKRQQAWESSKEVGAVLRDGLSELVELRNGTVQALGYDDYFDYQVSDYGMEVDEMMALNQRFITEVWPLYRQLHTWARYSLAESYGEPVPEMLPAHWLPNRWGQDWTSMVTVEGIDLDGKLAAYEPEWLVKQAEDFYQSLGFQALPESFWQRSSLYPLAPEAEHKKNNHASAWHMDLQEDVRCLMSVQPNQRWWSTTHHELGHIYYYISYTRPEVPVVLRGGANRGFHEAVGSLLGVASMQQPFLVAKGLVAEDAVVDQTQALLQEALDSIVFIPFASGTMTHFERDLYSGAVGDDGYNQRWWDYVAAYQGIVPPATRGEEFTDAATKTHINNDAAQYYDYAISGVLLHQLHRHIATKILQQPPQATNYYGRQDVGEFLSGILELGATQDWRDVMKEQLGEELSASAMLEYFAPLSAWLEEVNEGREHTLPESPTF